MSKQEKMSSVDINSFYIFLGINKTYHMIGWLQTCKSRNDPYFFKYTHRVHKQYEYETNC